MSRKRKVLWVIAIVLMVLAIGYLSLTVYVNRRVRKELTQTVPGRVSLSSVYFNLIHSTISLDSLSITLTSSSGHKGHSTFVFPKVKLEGVSLWKLSSEKSLVADKLIVLDADIRLDEQQMHEKRFGLTTGAGKPAFRQMQIKELQIKKAKVWISNNKESYPLVEGDVTLHHVAIRGLGDRLNRYNLHFEGVDCALSNLKYNRFPVGVSIKTIRASSTAHLLDMYSVNLHTLQNRNADLELQAFISKLQMRELNLDKLFGGKIEASEITMDDSKITVAERAAANRLKSLLRLLRESSVEVNTKRLIVKKTLLDYRNAAGSLALKGAITVHGLHLNANSRNSHQMFRPEAVDFNFTDVKFNASNSAYHIRVGGARMQSRSATLSLTNVFIIPRYGKYEFSRRLGYQADRIEGGIDRVIITHPDWNHLANKGVYAASVKIEGYNIHVFRDRRLPLRPDVQPLPMDCLKKMAFTVKIKELKMTNGEVSYEEFPKNGTQTGILRIERFALAIAPFTNRAALVNNRCLVLTTAGAIMGSGNVYATMFMPFDNDKYFIKGAINNLDLTMLNSSSENLGKIRIKSGLLDSLGFEFGFDHVKSSGKIVGIYHRLIIQPLKRKGFEQGEKKIAKFQSFMLRHLVIPLNKDRSMPQSNRTGTIAYNRDSTRMVSYYLLQSLLTGIKSSFKLGFLLPK